MSKVEKREERRDAVEKRNRLTSQYFVEVSNGMASSGGWRRQSRLPKNPNIPKPLSSVSICNEITF